MGITTLAPRISPSSRPDALLMVASAVVLGIEPPETLKGHEQFPIEGESFAAALTDPDAPSKSTQFYTMLGQRSIYHEGWLASTVHPPLSSWGKFDQDEWELYNLEEDRSQTRNLAAEESERLERIGQRLLEEV